MISPDFYDPTFQLRGPESYKQFEIEFFAGFPDWQEKVTDMIAEGDKVWVCFIAEGPHTGKWLGLAPTGKTIKASCVQIRRLVDGKVVEKYSVIDWLAALKELGIMKCMLSFHN